MKPYTPFSRAGSNLLLWLLFLTIFWLGIASHSSAAEMPGFRHLESLKAGISGPVAVSPDHLGRRLYVAEPGARRVVVLDQDGTVITKLHGLGEPISVAVDRLGRVYIGSRDKGKVEVYDAGFNLLFLLGAGDGEFMQPSDICVDASGRVYVADSGNNIVRIYNPSGQFIGSLGSPGSEDGQFHTPISLAIDGEAEEIVVLDRPLVSDGKQQAARIQFFDMNGTYKRGFSRYDESDGDMIRPQQVTVDSESRIYVTDSFQNVVLVYDNAGMFLGVVYDLVNPMRIPLGIAITMTNRLYIASRMGPSIERYDIGEYSNMAIAPASLTFQAREGGDNPVAQQVSVTNNGGAAMHWTAVANDSWISLSETGGMLDLIQSATLDAAVDVTGLAAGEHRGSFSISDGKSGIETVQVTLNVEPSPVLSVVPASLNLSSEVGTTPGLQYLTIANTGSAALNWTLATDQNWISVSRNSGTVGVGEPGSKVIVLADVTSLPAGTYTGTITVSGQDAGGSPAFIGVTLTLSDPGSDPGTDPTQTPPPGTTWQGNFGRKWTVVSQMKGISLNGIWGSSGTDIFAVGDGGTILHYDGIKWQQQDSAVAGGLNGVWGTSGANVFAVGDSGLILHYDGGKWKNTSLISGNLYDGWCSDDAKCLATGQSASILAGSDATNPWIVLYSLEYFGSLRGIWGSASTDVYAVGDFGTILHNDGSGWQFVDSKVDAVLYDVWGSAADDVYVVGQGGTIIHYDGSGWSAMESGTTATLTGIWGNAANEVYAVGEEGTMLLYQGAQWHKLETGVAEDLNDAWGPRRKEIYAVGSDGSILFGKVSFPWHLLLPALEYNGKRMHLMEK